MKSSPPVSRRFICHVDSAPRSRKPLVIQEVSDCFNQGGSVFFDSDAAAVLNSFRAREHARRSLPSAAGRLYQPQTAAAAANSEAQQLWQRRKRTRSASLTRNVDSAYSDRDIQGRVLAALHGYRFSKGSSSLGEGVTRTTTTATTTAKRWQEQDRSWNDKNHGRREKDKKYSSMSEYEQFIWLYSLIERRLQRLENQGVRKPWDKDLDDLFRRMLRDMDRKGSLPALLPQPDGAARRIDPSQYVWAELDRERYRSRFLPMRIHDLVRDDCAYRRWRRETQI